jgi:tetratricopeptide (TPR) repeat protein
VYYNSPPTLKKSEECFQKSLQYQKSCKETLFAFADLYIKTDRVQKALELLESGLLIHQCDRLHIKIGGVYLSISCFQNAMSHFEAALRFYFLIPALTLTLRLLPKDAKILTNVSMVCAFYIRR